MPPTSFILEVIWCRSSMGFRSWISMFLATGILCRRLFREEFLFGIISLDTPLQVLSIDSNPQAEMIGSAESYRSENVRGVRFSNWHAASSPDPINPFLNVSREQRVLYTMADPVPRQRSLPSGKCRPKRKRADPGRSGNISGEIFNGI
jgi:hypothetical protein